MPNVERIARAWIAAILLLTSSTLPGHAGTEVTAGKLQAVARALGFLSSLPSNGPLTIGVVYAQDQAGGEVRAGQVATMLDSIPVSGQRAFRASAIAVKDMAQGAFDAYFLMPGTASQGAAISDVVRRRHIVSISTDPACLDTNCCVLMVDVGNRVRIVLDTSLASASGARFSPVFSMMVEHK